MKDFMDQMWLLGETPGSHHGAFEGESYGLPGVNKMTPMEGLQYFGIPNLCRMKMGMDHSLSYLNDPYLVGDMKRCCLSIVGSNGWKADDGRRDDLDEILEFARRDSRVVAAIHDDFMWGDRFKRFPPEVLRQQREALHSTLGRPLELWSVFYEHNIGLDIQSRAIEFDVTTFWTWYGQNLRNMQKSLDFARWLTPDGRVILGIYMWDYGNKKPLTDDQMKWQLEFAYEKLLSCEIEGMMLNGNCCADVGLNTSKIAKNWFDQMKETG